MRRPPALLALLGLALVFCAAPHARATFIVNGSFEQSAIDPGLNVPIGSTGITGWTVIEAAIDYMDSVSSNPFVNVWTGSDGTRSLDLAGSPGRGGIEQTFSTTPGVSYVVSFDLAGNPESSPGVINPAVHQLTVSAAGQSAAFDFDITGKSFTNMGYETHTWKFVATGSTTTLAFTNTTTGTGGEFYGPVLDNVSVNAVPAPPVLVLALTGGITLLGWGWLRRKRGRSRSAVVLAPRG
jgi:choice-of-anchor C domain-containing protein